MEFSKNAPNGGFPSLYVVEEDTEKETSSTEEATDTKRKRGKELQVPKKVTNIKDILAERRHVTPFINLAPEDKTSN
jgi:hypothetical protein